MKKISKIVFYSLFAVSLMIFASCDDGGDSTPGETYAFSDSFNSYAAANPWTPEGGWVSNTADVWAIVTGYSDKGVMSINGINDYYMRSSYTGTDYTISVKVCPSAITYDFGFGICSRYNPGSYYAAILATNSSTHTTYLSIIKKNSSDGSLGGAVYSTTDPDTSTYYTLTLSVTGSVNPVITATVTDGTTSISATATDTGTVAGSVLTSGYAAIWTNAYANVIFDDFMVTEQ